MKYLIAFFFLAAALCVAGERPSPVSQPLAVIRFPDPAAVETLFATRPARALAGDAPDFSGRLPGLGARVDSLRRFFAGLAEAGAKDFWYCLTQGRTAIQQTGGMGWALPAGRFPPEETAGWLRGIGLATDKLELSIEESDGVLRLAAARDSGTLRNLFGGKGEEGWRRSLDSFAPRGDSALGVWLNPRPLLGLAALTTGFDARPLLARHRLNFPETVELELRPEGGDLGFAIRLGEILPAQAGESSSDLRIVDPSDAFLRLHIPGVAALAARFSVDLFPLALLNLDPERLRPQTASFVLWRGGDGSIRWRAAFYFSRAGEFLGEWRKITAYAGTPDGDFLLVRRDGYRAVVRPAPVEGGGIALVAAGDEGDLLDDIAVERVANPDGSVAVEWEVALGGEERADVVHALWGRAAMYGGFGVTASGWDAMLPDGETGAVRLDDGVAVASERGLLAFLAFAAPELRHYWLPRPEDEELVLSRLEFLLDVCHQFCYRGIGTAGGGPAPLPVDWREVASAGAEWFDSGFGKFPQGGEPLSRVVAALAAGREIDGVRYAIEYDGGDWFLAAASVGGSVIRLDAAGRIVER